MNNFIRVIFYGLILAGTFFLCRSCAYAESHLDEYINAVPPEHICLRTQWGRPQDQIKQPSQKSQRLHWKEDYDFHLSNGIRCYEDAKSKCWYLPNIEDREKARYCFTTSIAAVGNANAYCKLVAMVSSLLLQYGLDCMDEWDYIKTKLYWSSYHFELCDHYELLLKNA
jgi:hypothetical protein